MIAKPSLQIYAHGGPEVTTRSRFLKAPNTFRDDNEPTDYEKVGKGGTLAKMSGDKSGKAGRVPKEKRK